MIKVNLVPRDILDREVQRQRVLQATVAGSLLVIGVVVASLLHWYAVLSLDAKLKQANAEYDKLAKIVAQVEELEKTAGAVKVRLNVVNGLLKGRPLYPWFMADLLATMPPGVWLTNIVTTPKDPNGLGVVLANSFSNSAGGVSQWLRNFAGLSAKWDEPKLSAVTINDKGDVKEYTFTLTTAYKNSNL